MNRPQFNVVLLGLVTTLALVANLSGQEWTRFRGPNGTGISDSMSIPVQWAEGETNWNVALPGTGHSSPVVWGDRVFLLSANPEDATRFVLCYSAIDGKQLWLREYKSSAHHIHTRSSFASCTPAVDRDHVYVGWSTPDATTLMALDHDGEQVWSVDLGRWVGQHGFGASPMLYDEMVILHNSQQANKLDPGEQPGDSFMMAFDRKSGQEIWRTPLESVNVCYSVPFIFEPNDGPAELICTSTGNGVFSLNPKTGEENWAVEDAFKMRTVSSPIMAGGLVFGSTGSGGYSGNYVVAVRPGKQAEIAYELSNSSKFKAPYVPSAIANGDKVFLLYDRGFAACIDAPTGEIHWSERTGAAFSGSPIRVRDKIYCIDEEGIVWVFAADHRQYRVLAKNSLGEASQSTPAVSGGRMYLRTMSHLISVGGADEHRSD
jgi:outer membrane protein assembly factor BamB